MAGQRADDARLTRPHQSGSRKESGRKCGAPHAIQAINFPPLVKIGCVTPLEKPETVNQDGELEQIKEVPLLHITQPPPLLIGGNRLARRGKGQLRCVWVNRVPRVPLKGKEHWLNEAGEIKEQVGDVGVIKIEQRVKLFALKENVGEMKIGVTDAARQCGGQMQAFQHSAIPGQFGTRIGCPQLVGFFRGHLFAKGGIVVPAGTAMGRAKILRQVVQVGDPVNELFLLPGRGHGHVFTSQKGEDRVGLAMMAAGQRARFGSHNRGARKSMLGEVVNELHFKADGVEGAVLSIVAQDKFASSRLQQQIGLHPSRGQFRHVPELAEVVTGENCGHIRRLQGWCFGALHFYTLLRGQVT